MRMVDLIEKKRDGFALSSEEIHWMIEQYSEGAVPDYQMAAMAMAIYFRDMDGSEIAELTAAIVDSGETIDLSAITGTKVDKHSTGGVGDKTTLIVGPLVAAAGIPVAKMSGRGLGHTGGTIDKLEAIRGFETELAKDRFIRNVNEVKLAVAAQSGNLTPADKKLYGLRDVTATVDSIPLIASSVMSKKIASGADAIVLDVKTGSGAFMKTLEGARRLAENMVAIGQRLGRETVAVISDMSEPLGYEVGNANEVREAVDVLRGRGEERLTEVCLTLASHMAVCARQFNGFEEARAHMQHMLDSGQALESFRKFVKAQNGEASFIDDPAQLPQAAYPIDVCANTGGYVEGIDAEAVGVAAMMLGAGRRTKEDVIDRSVGITLKKKIGDRVDKGECIAVLHANDANPEESREKLMKAIHIGSGRVAPPPIVHEIVR
ncbi:MAG TPA: pyrimidine-nucleoside phosphorylase [Bacillales bacterium]|nr:pyrimidine-nucleoside phosphorylase [Bacillales bacterium]